MEEISKEHLSLAGEYAVASELCRRGYYAQLTLGNRKKTDILVDCGTRMIRIQVKAKQCERWPRITGVSKRDDDMVLVLVDYENKERGERPVFYVLTSADWEYFIKHDLADDVSTGRFRVDDDNIPIYVNKKGKDAWLGIALYPSNVSLHKERWDRVDTMLKRGS